MFVNRFHARWSCVDLDTFFFFLTALTHTQIDRFLILEIGSVLSEQHRPGEKRVDIFQPRAESGQPDVHGDTAAAVAEEQVRVLPGPRAEGRDHPIGRIRTGGSTVTTGVIA